MIYCSINHLKKDLFGSLIFKDFSIEVKAGERIAFVGPNGCGKTTLLKIISGAESMDEGERHLKKDISVGYLEQIPKRHHGKQVIDVLYTSFAGLLAIQEQMQRLEHKLADSNLSAKEMDKLLKRYGDSQVQFQEAGGYEMDSKINQVINGLNIEPLVNKRFTDLSGGEQTKVSLAVNILAEPDLLLLDEPTNHLDIQAMDWLESFIKQFSGAVILTSHDRYFLDRTVTKIYDLDDEEASPYLGGYTTFVKEKEERLLAQFHAYQEQQKKIKKMKATIKKLKEWANQANPPNAGLHRRAKSMEKALEKMEKVERPNNDSAMNLTLNANKRSGADVVICEELAFGYETLLFESCDLHIRYGERAAIVGSNGSGKSTLLKLILGDAEPLAGTVKIGANVNIGYLSQHTFFEDPTMTVLESFRLSAHLPEGASRHILAKFLFYGPDVFKRVETLSGGERVRLQLAQLMYKKINLLILDEPTNHLDIVSREVLEDALKDFQGTILAVSHDRYFLDRCFKKTYWLDNGDLDVYPGSFTYAYNKRQHV